MTILLNWGYHTQRLSTQNLRTRVGIRGISPYRRGLHYNSLFFMGKFDNIAEETESVSNLTDDHIKLYVESLVKRTLKGSVAHVAIENVLADFPMPIKIADADARLTT